MDIWVGSVSGSVAPVPNYVDGGWVPPTGSDSVAVSNPATGEPLGEVRFSGRKDVDVAVGAAKAAFPAWRRRQSSGLAYCSASRCSWTNMVMS